MTPLSSPPHHWVIGDIHGCAEALTTLVAKLPPADRLVFCGDLINRGPGIEAAMDLAWELVERGRAVWLRGNHEAELLNDLRRGEWQALRALATDRDLLGRLSAGARRRAEVFSAARQEAAISDLYARAVGGR
jgi:hypothetical protein